MFQGSAVSPNLINHFHLAAKVEVTLWFNDNSNEPAGIRILMTEIENHRVIAHVP